MSNTVATTRTSKPQTKAAPPVLGRTKEDALRDPLKTDRLTDSLAPAAEAPEAAIESGASLVQARRTAVSDGLVGTAMETLAAPGVGGGVEGSPAVPMPPKAGAKEAVSVRADAKKPSQGVAAPAKAPPAVGQLAQPAPVAEVAVVAPEAARAVSGGKPEPRRIGRGPKAPISVAPVKAPALVQPAVKAS